MSGWSNVSNVIPFTVKDPAGNTLFLIDGTGAHLYGAGTGWSIDLIDDATQMPVIFITDPSGQHVAQIAEFTGAFQLAAYPPGSPSLGPRLFLYQDGRASLQGTDNITVGPGVFFTKDFVSFGNSFNEVNPVQFSLASKFLQRGGTGSGWQSLTLANSWVARPNFFVPGYKISAEGRVFLRGMAQNGTINTTLATLPAEARPASSVQPVISTDAIGTGTPRVSIASTGVMNLLGMGSGATLVGLDTASFDLT